MGIKGRDLSKDAAFIPGPGAYRPEIAPVKTHHPTIRIGSEARIPGERTSIREVPGPGNYNPRKRPTSAAPAYGFGSSTRANGGKSTKDITPGPGSYRLPSRIQDVPSYLLPNRSTEFKFV